ncbi:MAG TPA: elongation factor G [Phycisphaerae bacterium]|nr:elongation factor G [Phycisphaerae bacterium]HOJ75382.1 elongation factor G [Phycisphaerae bacterium]HOM52622.1 elongation factor G [Phycisphaerae bacterium]HON66744.1 elongation factor G [Phycisphaerae bacterium]HOQ85403.1 elongation factor G [Phycisphaerae bacterium]
MDLSNLRNIGISAHIDSGKTTLSERILYYTGRIHKMGDVKGDVGTTMDHMELEKERGITITSAATTVFWKDKTINLIDTPGHVDFTIEVERSLRVLDGAVLVLCAVGGVQSQSLTVDRQMRRYNVPRIAFINKCDRTGADPARVVQAMETKLGHVAVPLQIPIGLEGHHEGVVDLIAMKAVYFDGERGEKVRVQPIPAELQAAAERARHAMLDTLSLYSDELMELMLEDKPVSEDLIHSVIREQTIAREITPVLMGSAFKNRGVQCLLDAIARYLPSPLDRVAYAKDNGNEGAEVALAADPDAPTVAMAFKIVDESFGQLTYTRVYQGRIEKGGTYLNSRTGRKQRVGRILRMHANEREEIAVAQAGDIVALIGVECNSGDTICAMSNNYSLESIHVAEPVISLSVIPGKNVDRDKLSRALSRFCREDPTFHVRTDAETGDTIISGMGELHLDIYIERLRREHNLQIEVGPPQVSYREAPTQTVEFNYKHRKQTGGSGQYAHVIGKLIPLDEDAGKDYEFENKVTGGRIPTEYIPSCDKGFQSARGKGALAGYEVVRVKILLEDGTSHSVDSSDLAFQICARDAFQEAYRRSKPTLLEPIFSVEVEAPVEFQGQVVGDLSSRRGLIHGTEVRQGTVVVTAEVPLARMFGYATDLRSLTQGKGTFSMEFRCYRPAPREVQEEIIAARKAAQRV